MAESDYGVALAADAGLTVTLPRRRRTGQSVATEATLSRNEVTTSIRIDPDSSDRASQRSRALTMFDRPRELADALRLLAAHPCTVLAGGTDYFAARVGLPAAGGPRLVDITAIAELRGIARQADGSWLIGATTTWSDLLQARLPPVFDALRAAAREVGGVQIQNRATIAGNLCHASPAADGMPVLLAMDACVDLISRRGGVRRLPLDQFVLGARRTARADDELVRAIHLPAGTARAVSSFLKLGARRYLVISVAMTAVVLQVDDTDRIRHCAIAVGACSAVAQRLPALEARIVGHHTRWLLEDALPIASAELEPLRPIDDIRAAARYRIDAVQTLIRRALRQAAAQSSEPR